MSFTIGFFLKVFLRDKKTLDDKVIFSKDHLVVTLYDDSIEFENYPFKPASIYPSGCIRVGEIKEIITNFFPPAILTKHDEIIFIPSNQFPVEALLEFGKKNHIKLTSRVDVWSMILEEFLDTQFGDDDKERLFQILEKNGISRNQCMELRKKLSPIMLSYNFDSCLWEWCYLGLYDLLNACSGNLIRRRFLMPTDEFQKFYFEAMRIACLGGYHKQEEERMV